MEPTITLDHGEGGEASAELVRDLFLRHLGTPTVLEDAAVLAGSDRIAFTTDSFVVRPLFFPGGDIGRLAVSGTVNDLAVMGAEPKYLSAGFILEEGFELAALESVVKSMASTAEEAGVVVATGDTKVVARGDADGMFINTSGVGVMPDGVELSIALCRPGDSVLVSGPIGDHGAAVVIARGEFGIEGDLRSDCQPLADLVAELMLTVPDIRCMRDPTRGGLASVLVEISQASNVGIEIEEDDIPIRRAVRSTCDLLGFDPLYMACEGRVVLVVPAESKTQALQALRSHGRGRDAAVIGEVAADPTGLVLKTSAGGARPLIALRGAQLPRIC